MEIPLQSSQDVTDKGLLGDVLWVESMYSVCPFLLQFAQMNVCEPILTLKSDSSIALVMQAGRACIFVLNRRPFATAGEIITYFRCPCSFFWSYTKKLFVLLKGLHFVAKLVANADGIYVCAGSDATPVLWRGVQLILLDIW